MPIGVLTVIYLLFFLSGAAALVYQVVWVRSLTLVFGGSHQAVTAVLTIFMSGLAIGAYVVGRRVDRTAKLLHLYGLLELGIAASALLFIGLMEVYPTFYVALARGSGDANLYLTIVRLVFATIALIVPTILMGGTLPVLSRLLSKQPERLGGHLSWLYGINTLGSVVGALLAGFLFLRVFSVSHTLYIAIATNTIVGLVSIALQQRAAWFSEPPAAVRSPKVSATPVDETASALQARVVLWGIGVSGFCALGYEVLWTRVLIIGVGASVYGFTVMLVAFLTGIALGSKGYGLVAAWSRHRNARRSVAWFGLTQLLIGLTALAVTIYVRDIPVNIVRLQGYFFGDEAGSFGGRTWASFSLAFMYMLVPALFMGAAFPLAGDLVSRQRRAIGRGVGEVLASNTLGAIVGAAGSGLVMVPLFGIERSLQILIAINVGLGGVVLASLGRLRWLPAAVGTCTIGVIGFLAVNQGALRMWDRQYFAIFRSNQPDAFRTPEMVREAVENTDVLYYAEGTESIVSVIKVKGGEQAFLTNGRVEASSYIQGQQVQYALGHLPTLLASNPRQVLVVGMGSGMTTGSTAVHPSVERVTLVEIEPQVKGVARAFGKYNHGVLDNPKVRVVFNDGRNFLLTTDEKFDVITADPIHPWFRGAGYLYAREYFQLARTHLRSGGVIAQWLPLYELTPRDVASIVRTFQEEFPYTMLWLTHFDSVMVGSSSPFAIDEAELQRRIAEPAVSEDLRRVMMGSAADLLSYFMMGTEGMKRFGQRGVLNTDDHLYLEFSAPFSIGASTVMSENIRALSAYRESLLPYLKLPDSPAAREEQRLRCEERLAAGRLADPALALLLQAGPGEPSFAQALRHLNLKFPWYAPGAFLDSEYRMLLALEPRLLQQSAFTLQGKDGTRVAVEISAVLVPVSKTRGSIMFVDNRSRTVFGQIYIDEYDQGGRADRVAGDVMAAVRAAYDTQLATAHAQKQDLPAAAQALEAFKAIIASEVRHVGAL
ncbi:MAG: fused MFS/spermidine synthase [Acidobacteriota bacterium]